MARSMPDDGYEFVRRHPDRSPLVRAKHHSQHSAAPQSALPYAVMPELPEVETVCRGLSRRLRGRRFVRVEQHRKNLRIPLPKDLAPRLIGQRVERVSRRAKYILVHLDDATVMLAHLGMSGRLVIHEGQRATTDRHDHVVLHTDDGASIAFNDVRRFGLLTLVEGNRVFRHPLLADLGPEPLDEGFGGGTLAAALAGKRTPIKSALLDQRVVAGLGNIYTCESLYRARISPRRMAGTVVGKRADRLASAVRAVLLEAIAAGGSSLRDYLQTTGEMGYFQHRFAVYGREGSPCPDCFCGGAVRRIVQSGRATFFCPRRQR